MVKANDPTDPVSSDQDLARDAQDRTLGTLARKALGRRRGALPPPSQLDDELLLRYLDNGLSDGEREALERRLVDDLDATERLGILAGALHEAGVPRHEPKPAMLDRALHAVSRHVFFLGRGVLELLRGEDAKVLVPATVRSADPSRPTAFQIDRLFHTAQGPLAARFELHAERADRALNPADPAQSPALLDLVVHVDAGGQPAEGVRCKLLRDGRPIDSREVEAVGCTFSRLGPARYDVELRKGGVEIGRVLFDLRG